MPSPKVSELKSEERLIPIIRARLAERLIKEGFRPKQVAAALNVTQAAVTQYLKKKRGGDTSSLTSVDRLVDPLAERLAKRVRSGLGGVETTELVETARQVMVMSRGRSVARGPERRPERDAALRTLRERLKLELTAAERYLELSNQTTDDYSKMLLRMIAADSIRHGDVVSQVISWLEAGREADVEMPGKEILQSLIELEDSAHESSLSEHVKISHPIARLLFQWIDADEEKHEMVVQKMLGLEEGRRKLRPP